MLHDAHPWNVLFEGPRATYVDLGSIVPGRRVSWAWHREFRRHFMGPCWPTVSVSTVLEIALDGLIERAALRRSGTAPSCCRGCLRAMQA